jgi:hypothetical protein
VWPKILETNLKNWVYAPNFENVTKKFGKNFSQNLELLHESFKM